MGDTMSSPEKSISGKGENTYGMATQRGELTGTRTAPTTPDRHKTKVKEGEEKGLSKGAKLALAGLAALGTVETTGAIIQEQINHEPLSATTIPADLMWPWNLGKSAVEDISRVFRKEISVPPTIDNSANKIVVKTGVNAIPVNTGEIVSLNQGIETVKSIVKNEGDFPIVPEIKALLPAQLINQGSVEITTVYGASYRNPTTGEPMPQFLAYKDIFLVNAKGTEISAGMLYGIGEVKSIMVFRNPPLEGYDVPQTLPYRNDITVRFATEEGPIFDVKMKASDDDIRQIVPLDIVKNAPILPRKHASKGHPIEWTQEDTMRQGTLIDSTTRLLKTNYDNSHLWYSVTAIFPNNPVGDQYVAVGNVAWSNDNNKLQYPN